MTRPPHGAAAAILLSAATAAAFMSLAASRVRAAGGFAMPTPGLIAAAAGVWEETGGSFDRSSRLAAGRRFAEAYAELEPGADALRVGIAASLALAHDEAVRNLTVPSENAYLDRYRLFYLARSLHAGGRAAEAFGAISSIPLPDSLSAGGGDEFHSRVRELFVEIASSNDSLFALSGVPSDMAGLSGRSRYAVALALVRAGRDSLAARTIAEACGEGIWRAEDRGALSEALALCEKLDAPMTRRELLGAASAAFSGGLRDAARGVLSRLLERDPADARALVLKARLHAADGRHREAAALYTRVIDGKGDIASRREALERLAGLEYGRGRRERAAELYRSYYARFSDDPRRDGMLARAARIDISLGNLERGYEAFREIAGPRISRGETVLDAEHLAAAGALARVLGRESELYGALEERLAAAYGERARSAPRGLFASAAVPYWLWRTAPPGETRDRWRAALNEEFPHSTYAVAAAGVLDSLLFGPLESSAPQRARAMGAADRRFIESLPSSPSSNSAGMADEALDAYRRFLDWGFADEACECAASAARLAGGGSGMHVVLYREARLRGFHRLALRIVSRSPGEFRLDRETLERIQYPAAYATVVAVFVSAKVPPELLFAVMREESAFDPDAVSRAGAVGLMQLMPATARWLGRERGRHGDACADLDDPSCSIALGERYLAYLAARFDGSIVGALAAYNGGEGRMSRWKKQFDPAGDPMTAMALIGPQETRRYVEKVLDSMCRYRSIAAELEGAPK